MELNPKLKLRKPIETPFKMPKRMTVFMSTGLFSKKFMRRATCRVQYVTIRCQLVNVVAGKIEFKAFIQIILERLLIPPDKFQGSISTLEKKNVILGCKIIGVYKSAVGG